MGYSKALSAVEKVENLLSQMYYKRQTIVLPTRDAYALTYQLYEGMHAAEHHESKKHLASVREMYEFRKKPGRVECRFLGVDRAKIPTLPMEDLARTPRRTRVSLPIDDEVDDLFDRSEWPPEKLGEDEEADPEPRKLQVPEVLNLHGIVGAVLRYSSEADELFFPDAVLSEEEKPKLQRWCDAADRDWKFIDHEDAGVTLTTLEVVAGLAWEGENVDTA